MADPMARQVGWPAWLPEVACVAGLTAGAIELLTRYPSLPNRVATHFGISGAADSWGSKGSIVALPIVALVMYAVLTILQRYPKVYNYPVKITPENSQRQAALAVGMLRWTKALMVLLFAYLTHATIASAQAGEGRLSLAVMGLLLAGVLGVSVGYFSLARRAK